MVRQLYIETKFHSKRPFLVVINITRKKKPKNLELELGDGQLSYLYFRSFYTFIQNVNMGSSSPESAQFFVRC